MLSSLVTPTYRFGLHAGYAAHIVSEAVIRRVEAAEGPWGLPGQRDIWGSA